MKKYLMSLGLKDFEANYILGQVENAGEFTVKELKGNTNILLKYVPKESLTQIILLTPSIIFHDGEYLENQLKEIQKDYSDVEHYLLYNDNPI